MKRSILFYLVLLISSDAAYSDNKELVREPFTIQGMVVSKETGKPIEANCAFCAQIGENLIDCVKSVLTDEGRFTLVLPEKPDKEIGHYALYVSSLMDAPNPKTGQIEKVQSFRYITRFFPINIPDTGNVCIMPILEMEKVKYVDETWPYELPARLLEMEREDSINNSATNQIKAD